MPRSTDPAYRWVVLTVATLAQASSGFIVLGVGAVAGFVRYDLGLTTTATGALVAAAGLAPIFALLPVGHLLDVFGERRIVSLGGAWLGVGAIAAASASSYGVLVAILFIGGVGYATSQPGGSKAVARWFERGRRGLAMGVRQTGLPLGGALAAALLPAAASAWGWRVALVLAGAVGVTGAMVFFVVYRDPSRSDADTDGPFRERFRDAIGDPAMRPVLLVGLAAVSGQFCIATYLMLFLRDAHGLALTTGGWLLFGVQIGGMAGRVVLAAVSDHTRGGRLVPVAISLGASAAGLAVLAVLPRHMPLGVLAVFAVALGFFAFGWYGPWVAHVAELAGGRSVGLTLGLAMTANQVGIAAAPPLFGLAVDASGYTVAWSLMAALLAVVALRVGLVTHASPSRSRAA